MCIINTNPSHAEVDGVKCLTLKEVQERVQDYVGIGVLEGTIVVDNVNIGKHWYGWYNVLFNIVDNCKYPPKQWVEDLKKYEAFWSEYKALIEKYGYEYDCEVGGPTM